MLTIRSFQDVDAEALWCIYFHSIRSINRRDYSQEQVAAWGPKTFCAEKTGST